jgi:hypothetical protein
MTTDRLELRAARAWRVWVLRSLCGAAALLALSCAHGSQARHGDRLDVSAYPPAIQRDYAVFARRCSRCHTLARPLNAQIRDPQHWVRYVTRMRRNPSSGINRQDADLILEFLLFYTARTQQQEQAEDENASEPPQHDVQPQRDAQDVQPQPDVQPKPDVQPQPDVPSPTMPPPTDDDAAGAATPATPIPAPVPANEGALP